MFRQSFVIAIVLLPLLFCDLLKYRKYEKRVYLYPHSVAVLKRNSIDYKKYLLSAAALNVVIHSCLDAHVNCFSWKDQNVCGRNEIQQQCPVACGMCTVIPTLNFEHYVITHFFVSEYSSHKLRRSKFVLSRVGDRILQQREQ